MNKYLQLLFPLFLLISLNSCKTSTAYLSGKLDLKSNKDWQSTIYLVQPRSFNELATSYAGLVVDSAKIASDGSFQFHPSENAENIKTGLYLLTVQKTGQKYPNQLENKELENANYAPIIFNKDKPIFLQAQIEHLQATYTLESPSKPNQAIIELRDIRLQSYRTFKAKIIDTSDDESLIEQADALRAFQKPLIDFANTTKYYYPALLATRWVAPANDYERVAEFLDQQCQKWTKGSPNHTWTKELCQKANTNNLPILIGNMIPKVDLPMLDKSNQKLSALLGERLTLIDFWASWCAPCRKENKNVLVDLWEKQKTKGFEIIGYALESDTDSWAKAIQKDGAYRWKHASHLQGDEAPLMQSFRIQTIPANYLVDHQGKVVAKNLHGKDLVEFVENFLK